MKVTSADIQFLIGCTRREAERIIIDAISRDNIDGKFKVKSSTEIEVSDIKKRLLSVDESMDGKILYKMQSISFSNMGFPIL